MTDFNEELKEYLDAKFEQQKEYFDSKLSALEEKLNKTPTSKKTPSKVKSKTPVKKLPQEVGYKNWIQGFENPDLFKLTCHYVPKSGRDANMICNCTASYMLVGEPTKRTFKLISKENPLQDIIKEYGKDPKNSFPYIRCNTHKGVCLSDNISKAVEFIGTLDNGAVIHADETEPSEESIAASLSAKPTSPLRSNSPKLLTPEELSNKEENDASGPKEEILLPVVDHGPDNDNGDLEDLLSSLN